MTIIIKIMMLVSFSYSGYAAHYQSGMMEGVSYYRGMPLVDCMIASPYEQLGTWLEVTSLLNGTVKECRVTDIAAPDDRDNIISRGIVIEFDLASAMIMCNISYYGQEPPRACPVYVSVIGQSPASVEAFVLPITKKPITERLRNAIPV